MPKNFLEGPTRTRFEAQLPGLLKGRRWFGGKARDATTARIIDTISIPSQHHDTVLVLIDVAYRDAGHETYVLLIASAVGEEADNVSKDMPRAVLLHSPEGQADGCVKELLYDAMWDSAAMHTLLRAMGDGARFEGEVGALQGSRTTAYEPMVATDGPLAPRVLNAEQSNTSVAFGDRALLKLYRRTQPGVNPDWEIGRYLTSRAFFHSPAVGGALEYVVRSGEATTVALLQAFVRNQGDAWAATLRELDEFLTRVVAETPGVDSGAGKTCTMWDLAQTPVSEKTRDVIGPTLEAAAALGRLTAVLHRTLGEADDPDFASEPLTSQYREARHHSMLQLWQQVVSLVRQRSMQGIPIPAEASDLLAQDAGVLAIFQAVLEIEQGGRRIRCHGDYHLGQVLWTGSDYVVTDFEGEPARPLHERRMKHSPLYDVAGMLRSFDYASWTALANNRAKAMREQLEPWTTYWSRWVRAHFLATYVTHVKDTPFWPPSSKDAARLLTVYQLEKAVYELGYELNNRPEWVAIPLKGINEIIQLSGARAAA
ncbi:MAG TPA: putative maltokinase [Nitrospira sp.]|nr:putative maltokinase [Nitrospira sp.]